MAMTARIATPTAFRLLECSRATATPPTTGRAGAALSEVLDLEREVVLDWDEPQDWFTQDYCLIFRPPTPSS